MNLDLFDIKGRRAVKEARNRYRDVRMQSLLDEIRRQSPELTKCPYCDEIYDARRKHRSRDWPRH